jgi:hypothetical protein
MTLSKPRPDQAILPGDKLAVDSKQAITDIQNRTGMNLGRSIRRTGPTWDFDVAAASFDQHGVRSIPQLGEQHKFVARLARLSKP